MFNRSVANKLTTNTTDNYDKYQLQQFMEFIKREVKVACSLGETYTIVSIHAIPITIINKACVSLVQKQYVVKLRKYEEMLIDWK